MSDGTGWIDLDALASDDPARAAIVNHLETADDIAAEDIETAIEQSGLQLLQQLYEQSMNDEGDPRAILSRMGVLEAVDPETAEQVDAAKDDAQAAAPNDDE